MSEEPVAIGLVLFSGGISQLKAFLAPLKRGGPEPLVLFDTAPGG